VHDATGAPVATIDALGKRTTQVFDAAVQRMALVDANANRTSFTCDDAGRSTQMTDTLDRSRAFLPRVVGIVGMFVRLVVEHFHREMLPRC
jgi:YD repeat-containing protein